MIEIPFVMTLFCQHQQQQFITFIIPPSSPNWVPSSTTPLSTYYCWYHFELWLVGR
jgi:hypothetical protein